MWGGDDDELKMSEGKNDWAGSTLLLPLLLLLLLLLLAGLILALRLLLRLLLLRVLA